MYLEISQRENFKFIRKKKETKFMFTWFGLMYSCHMNTYDTS